MGEPLKKITVNVPEGLLTKVKKSTDSGTTEVVIEGLRELEKREKRSALRSLRGKIILDLDLDQTRK